MSDHSPAVIAAAKALAEKHGVPSWAVRDWGHLQAALCEAILTTPPSEEAMSELLPCPVCCGSADYKGSEGAGYTVRCTSCGYGGPWGDYGYQARDGWNNLPRTPKPEPTEDHLRRACEECNADFDAFITRQFSPLAVKAISAVARLLAERDADCDAANQQMAEAAERIQELKAERDAMQARVDGWQDITTAPKDGTWFVAAQNGETYPCEWRVEEPDEGAGKAGWWDHFNQSFEEPTHWMPTASAEPAPDPDLVLAREAAESLGLVDTATKMIAESVALRALKLAKERG